MRTEVETLVDRLLLLYAVVRANEYGRMEGPFKLQKIPFASQLEMHSRKTRGFNYHFFQYTHGPISKEIYHDGEMLTVSGLITGLRNIEPTQRGAHVFESMEELFVENRAVTDIIDAVARAYAPLSFRALKRKIYKLSIEWAGETWKIGEMPECTDVLDKIEPASAQVQFNIDDVWIDSLWGSFNYTKEEKQKLYAVHKVAS